MRRMRIKQTLKEKQDREDEEKQQKEESAKKDRLRESGPPWLRGATVLERIENYLRSGASFVYLQVALTAGREPASES